MTLYLVTLNIGHALAPNARRSHEAAAARWGATYLPLNQYWTPPGAARGWFGQKFEFDLLPVEQPCRVCWLDADTVVSANAPSIFDAVPEQAFGAVANVQDGTHADPDGAHRPAWDRVCRALGARASLNVSTYVNGGVLVFSLPHHCELFGWIAGRWHSMAPVGPMDEQTALNVALAETGALVALLGPRWNRLGRDAWGGKIKGNHILHLANIGQLRGDKRPVIERIEWSQP